MLNDARRHTSPVGVILAGGRGWRLGGVDKGLCLVGGRPVLSWIAACLAPQCHALVLNANGDPDRFARFGLPVVADDPLDQDTGPLAGVLAAMTHVAQHWPDRDLLTVTADTPFLPGDLAQRLGDARETVETVAVARSGDHTHPLAALWPTAAGTQVRAFLRVRGLRRVESLQATFPTRPVTWPGGVDDPFLNINTADDLAAAERRAMAANP